MSSWRSDRWCAANTARPSCASPGRKFRSALPATGGSIGRRPRFGFDPDRLQIEKVAIEDGHLNFADAGERRTGLRSTGFWFKGDLRSLLGPVKGEGGFVSAGERYGYRVAASRIGDDGSVKVKLGIDPADHPLAIEADGALRLEENAPRFDGTLTLSRPAAMARADGRGSVAVPWRASAKVKAAPQQALFEQLEYQYGPDERAIRLNGTAELRFGKNPRFEGVLSARQVDLDRALALPRSATACRSHRSRPSSSRSPPPIGRHFPVRLGIGVDAVTLAAGTLQSVRGDLKLDGDDWDIETLEFRAPGFAQVRLSGRVARSRRRRDASRGRRRSRRAIRARSSAWLEGRAEVAHGAGRHAARRRRSSRSARRSSRSSGSSSSSTARRSRAASPMRRRAAPSRRASTPSSRPPSSMSTACSPSAVRRSTAPRSNGRA